MKRGSYLLANLLLIVTLIVGVYGCSAPSTTDIEYDSSSPVVVWIDAARKPAADKYLETHPDKASLVTFEIVDRGELAAKVLLFNNAGSGWPDVVFAEPSIVMYNADEAHDLPMDLTPWVDSKIIDQFVPGALDSCYKTTDGVKELLCLRNDIAPLVLWYNKTLMDEFGYKVPTTWEEYVTLSDQVAKEHPGYYMGSTGSSEYNYFWPSGCPMAHQIDANTVHIDTSDPKCTRVTQMIDHMIANGTMSKYGQFDPKFIEIANNNKLLMIQAANWFGDFVFGGKEDSSYYKTSEHQLAAAMPLKWSEQTNEFNGAWGGSAWLVSKHTKNPELAVSIAVYMTTDIEVGKLVGTMPAYGPAAEEWKKGMDANPLYAMNPYDVMVAASAAINTEFTDAVRYSLSEGIKPYTTAIEQDQPTTPTLPDCETQLKILAEKEGYKVVKTAP
ncbi:MAG: extracellular solute-binding protein [Chloroflexi bacterium]|nr:extracellular solute-binding protein [Chloroflexota bacterium]